MEDTGDELRMLRARAYGPSADIHTDPEALARLAELERATQPIATPAAEPAVAADTASVPAGSASAASGTVAGLDIAPPPAEDEPASRPDVRRKPAWAPRWSMILWPVSVVAALALGAVTTSAAMPLVSRGGGSAQVAVLLPDPTFDWPEGFFGPPSEGAVGYEVFFGLRALTTSGERFLPNGADICMLLTPTANIPSDGSVESGPTYYGCGAGAFPATVVLTIDEELPLELRSRFPVGSALQFVFDGERVGVFSDAEG
jgi:hypothetical protein